MLHMDRWIRTKHAILFRLSDRSVQVIFHDKTEIFIMPDYASVTYTNKLKEKSTYHLPTVFQISRPDLKKRLRYVQEILFQLV
jgi:polo-like kinase 1